MVCSSITIASEPILCSSLCHDPRCSVKQPSVTTQDALSQAKMLSAGQQCSRWCWAYQSPQWRPDSQTPRRCNWPSARQLILEKLQLDKPGWHPAGLGRPWPAAKHTMGGCLALAREAGHPPMICLAGVLGAHSRQRQVPRLLR